MVLGNAVGDHSQACAIETAMPERAVSAEPSGESLVHFRICKRLRFAVVPAKATESGKVARETLLQVYAEAVLASDVPGMVGDVRARNQALLELRDSIAINPHVRIVSEGQYADHASLPWQNAAAEFVCKVFGMGLPRLPDQINSVCYLGHQRFDETESPITIFIISGSPDGVTPRIGGIVIGTIVVNRPVGELKMSV